MKRKTRPIRTRTGLILALSVLLLFEPVAAFAAPDTRLSVKEAAMRLVQFCQEPKTGLDESAAAVLVDYVLGSQSKENALPTSFDCHGAYHEFDTKIAFASFLDYSYNPLIPTTLTRPSSLRYSRWSGGKGDPQKLPGSWKPVPPGGVPFIVHGFQRDSNTPDLTTGVYHAYDLKRTLILLNHKGRQALVSVSKQIGKSNVGEKGFILGNDSDWNYYYTGEPGSAKAGLGWVKSYIYDYYAVGVFVETDPAATLTRTGVFQWLRAGWSGINFVRTAHILEGLKRFAANNRAILESPRLPAPSQMAAVYQWLGDLTTSDLGQKYAALQEAQRLLAHQAGKIGRAEAEEPKTFAGTTKDQMVEELMLEYLKTALGKPIPAGKRFTLVPPLPLS